MHRRTLHLARPVDLRLTLGPVRHGRDDPTIRFTTDGVWWATRTAAGSATIRLVQGEGTIEATAWGDGADAALDRAPGMVGAGDTAEFHPDHELVAELHRRSPGLRICRTEGVFEALLAAICEQKVTGFEARRAWRQLVQTMGEPAPGPTDLLVAPAPDRLADAGYYEFHPMGLEKRRADLIRRVAAHSSSLEGLVELDLADAYERMTAIVGIGPWTAAEVALVALGDADAVSVGDYHHKHTVAWALAGEARGTDERMLELLEPFRGHRGRVLRLLDNAGITAPRRGPRRRLRHIERH